MGIYGGLAVENAKPFTIYSRRQRARQPHLCRYLAATARVNTPLLAALED